MALESLDLALTIEEKAERRCDASQMQWLRPWPRSLKGQLRGPGGEGEGKLGHGIGRVDFVQRGY